MNNLDYKRLLELQKLVKYDQASKAERDEYMELLYLNGSISEKQYKDYRSGRNVEDITGAAVAVGAILLLAYLLKNTLE